MFIRNVTRERFSKIMSIWKLIFRLKWKLSFGDKPLIVMAGCHLAYRNIEMSRFLDWLSYLLDNRDCHFAFFHFLEVDIWL
jgi:hypothetical protein